MKINCDKIMFVLVTVITLFSIIILSYLTIDSFLSKKSAIDSGMACEKNKVMWESKAETCLDNLTRLRSELSSLNESYVREYQNHLKKISEMQDTITELQEKIENTPTQIIFTPTTTVLGRGVASAFYGDTGLENYRNDGETKSLYCYYTKISCSKNGCMTRKHIQNDCDGVEGFTEDGRGWNVTWVRE
jgi:uncharacterized protein (UPF0333 family)